MTTTSAPAPRPDARAARTDEAADIALDVRSLRCRYGDYEAVRGIDLTVHHGELFALLGTNGAGKTTTLDALGGQRPADAGTVSVLGRDPRANRRWLGGRVGVVAQHTGLPGDLTPREAIRLWARLTPGARAHRDVAEALGMVALSGRADVRVRQLSGGERRRLDLAIALVHHPTLLFLDEPTTGMDPAARTRTWEVVRELLDDGVTVVLTTHYLEEAEALADRLAILHEGRIAVEGTVAEVAATQPARIEVRPPLDTPPPPALGGRMEAGPNGHWVVRTRALQADLTALLRWAEAHDVTLEGISARDASLEQVFNAISNDTEVPR